MVNSNLYRQEAIEAAKDRLGGPVNNFGVKSWIIIGFMVAAFAVTIIFISIARYTKKETVLGQVVPADGVARVAALRGGIIKKVLVKSGDFVTAGQPMFLVSYDSVLESGEALSGRVNAATDAQALSSNEQTELSKAQIFHEKIELQAKLNGLENDIAQYQNQSLLQADRVALLEKTVAGSLALFDQKYISAVQLRQREDALLQARQSLLQIEQSAAQAKTQIEQIRTQIQRSDLSLKEVDASFRYSRAQLDQKQLSDRSDQAGNLIAPKTGRVTSVQAREGDVIAGNQTLSLVVPDTAQKQQQVQLWVPSRAVGFAQVGNKVRLMFDAFPYQTFGVGTGRVIEISTAPVMPTELPVPIKTEEQMYKIVVALDRDQLTAYGRNWPLVPGMRLTADLVLDEKSLLEWLLDPLTAARKRADV